MSTLGTYSFLPWLRQGLANRITAADFDASVKVRATMQVTLEARGEKLEGGTEAAPPVERTVALFGPGDIVGIDRRAIVRTEPRHWITNFEPNYLAHIEFYDEDFPWRYTPAAPDLTKSRLRPWITLLVLEEGEFTDGRDVKDKPLPYIEVADLGVFPRAEELWAWAHVHVNRSLAPSDDKFVSEDMGAVIPKLQAVLNENPDLAYSRLVCPRKLGPDKSYHAFLVPSFEPGRLAGLGLDLGNAPATMSAWDASARPEGQRFPYYHRWFFRTGATGDFETLVRLLEPKPVDPRVGIREMDPLDASANLAPLTKAELGGILRLGGALRQPKENPDDPFEKWDEAFPEPLEVRLAELVNLPDTYAAEGEADPIVAPPLYGRWYLPSQRLLTERDGTPIAPQQNWIHRLNLDPRFRVPAGFGTRVIQDQQEQFMDAAWDQIGTVLEARQRIRLGQFGLLTSLVWYDRHLEPMLAVSPQRALLMLAPLNKRILSGGATLHHTLGESVVQPAMTSAALRRIARPRSRLMRSLPFDAERRPEQLLERVNAGEASAAPPKTAPPGVVTADQIAEELLPSDAPPAVVDWLRRIPRLPTLLKWVAVVLAIVLFLLSPVVGFLLGAALVAVAFYISRRLARWNEWVRASETLREDAQTPAAVDRLPASADFRITEPGDGFTARQGGADSVEAARFKTALRDRFEMAQLSAAAGRVPERAKLDLSGLAKTGIAALDPTRTIPKRIMAGVTMPPRIRDAIAVQPTESFVEPMAYPVIDLPMYEPLKNLSAELFLPNINLIEQNSITLLATNQRFIEAYMVGLNHEFARELLWREYPTDQRGTTFRQFWDVRSYFNAENLDAEALREKLRDIPPLHTWGKDDALGDHDHREQGQDNEDELVLVIRGELLKRYPTAVIYAHRACWQRKSTSAADAARHPCDRSGAIDNTQERRLAPLTAAEEANPPRSKVLTPLYEAKVDPDIYFFGFDLTREDVEGGTGEHPDDDPGWFFVIKERPGEPRFGLDNEEPAALQVWNDLSWPQVQPKPPGSYIEIGTAPMSFGLSVPTGEDSEKAEQHGEDVKVAWNRNKMSSAELAYILYQAPVLVAVHAKEMLPPDVSDA